MKTEVVFSESAAILARAWLAKTLRPAHGPDGRAAQLLTYIQERLLEPPTLAQVEAYVAAWDLPRPDRLPLTDDAIHNWDARYVQRRYHALAPEVKAAAQAAMVRHHQQGTSARDEASLLNAQFGLTG